MKMPRLGRAKVQNGRFEHDAVFIVARTGFQGTDLADENEILGVFRDLDAASAIFVGGWDQIPVDESDYPVLERWVLRVETTIRDEDLLFHVDQTERGANWPGAIPSDVMAVKYRIQR